MTKTNKGIWHKTKTTLKIGDEINTNMDALPEEMPLTPCEYVNIKESSFRDWHHVSLQSGVNNIPRRYVEEMWEADLFVQELSGVLLDVSFIQVSGEAHQTDLRQTKVGQLNVAHGRDQKTMETQRAQYK